MKPKPPREYVVNGLLSTGSLSIWYGQPGSLKTMALLDMALSTATGKPWLPNRPGGDPVAAFKTLPSPVLWLDQDSGEDEIDRRIEAIAKTKGVTDDTPFYSLSFPMPAFLGDDNQAVDMLIKHANEIGARLIVIDSLNAISGEADENSPGMATVMHGLRQVAERTRAAVVVIHHPSKDNNLNLRGHSSINGAIDLAMAINRDTPDAVDISFEATKTRQAPIKPFGAYFAYSTQDGDPKALKEACFFGTGTPIKDIKTMKPSQAAKVYIREIKPEKMSQSAIVEAVQEEAWPEKIGRHAILTALKEMSDEFTTERGEKNAVFYSLK